MEQDAAACPGEQAVSGVQGEPAPEVTVATVEKIDAKQALGLLSRGEVLQHMRAAVAAMGEDFVYNPGGSSGQVCYNVAQPCFGEDDPRAKTGCLVGRILLASGRVSKEFLEGHARRPWDFFAEKARMTYDAGLLLGVAQRIQDTGGTWGEALRVCTLMFEVMFDARERRLEF